MGTPTPTETTDPHSCKDLMWETTLINKVKEHPQLYDFNHKDYKESRKCIQTWLSIAQELGLSGQWKMCKERWRTLRDVYVRNRKSYLVGGERARRRPRWKFFDQMNFLHTYINHRAIEAERTPDYSILWQGNNPPPATSDSDSNDGSPVLQGGIPSPSAEEPSSKDNKWKREVPEEEGSEESQKDNKRARLSDNLPTKSEKDLKQSTAVEDLDAALLRETDSLAFTLDGRPIKQEVEWTDEEMDVMDKDLLKTASPVPSPTAPPQPPPVTEEKKPLMFKLKLPGGKSIPATFITDPKQAFIKKKVGMIMPTPLKSVPIKIKTVTGSQLRTSSQAPVLLPQQPSPPPKQGATPILKEESKTSGNSRTSQTPTPCPEQVKKSVVKMSTPQDSVLEDEEELFGRYVAAAIRKLTSRSKSLAKMRIQQVLFYLEESDRTESNTKDSSMAGSEK